MIYITGDTHGTIDFPKLTEYFSHRYNSENDFLIILGDAGMVWSEDDVNILEFALLGPTVLFIDGNHENFELLNKFPVVNYHGAKCHRLYHNVFHIKRGEIIDLNGLSFFCMGGASSTDKEYRINRVSWWEEENITSNEILNGMSNLEKVNFKVDYVLSHCAPSSIVKKMFHYSIDKNTGILEQFAAQIKYKHWYFGHYHNDKSYNQFRCFYRDILEIPAMKTGSKKANQPLYRRPGDYDQDKYSPYLINCKTNRRTSLKEEDLPEWYYHNYSYGHWYYCLKGVTDVAFHGSPFDNHLSKDSVIYLSYHGTLNKTKELKPTVTVDWDSSTWRCQIVDFCLGLEKYSPHLNLDGLKAQINLIYDQYNQSGNNETVVRPFPSVKTPRYQNCVNREYAHYVVLQGKNVLSEFIQLDRAIEYAEEYIRKTLGKKIIPIHDQNFIKTYKTGYDTFEWLYVKKLEELEKN